ncbi:tRNA pseudouridine38/39 synthase [Nematocida major]|uniref:tRNA pseudouridine38/39 synthase n=1 Tax=Nematocida major TaxID=1912982 RepID=UPI002007C881|nr:tRNA pseudouridine38/39 synthase [Nematocida major]KAH9386966.1 tRNA pseudouridine38/39 synthase [Nematocida major]
MERPLKNALLKISYNGRDYHGFAMQPGLLTVEHFLVSALVKSGLLKTQEPAKTETYSPEVLQRLAEMRYHKCGRTDAGVSAAAQYVSLLLPAPTSGEYPYDLMLNQHMPKSIRVLGWMFVPEEFSARFSCTSREYEYYFALTPEMSIEKMRIESQKLIGKKWFGRLSRPEKESSKKKRLQKFGGNSPRAEDAVRTVEKIEFLKISESPGANVWAMRIRARSFLHNQVRKIFGLLHAIGNGKNLRVENVLNREEKQEVEVRLAEAEPLVLAACTFRGADLSQLKKSPGGRRHSLRKVCEEVMVSSRVSERVASEEFTESRTLRE